MDAATKPVNYFPDDDLPVFVSHLKFFYCRIIAKFCGQHGKFTLLFLF